MKKKEKIFIISVFALGILLGFVGFSEASTIFTDDFNNYNVGNLNGQGGWTAYNAMVHNSTVYEGQKAVSMLAMQYASMEKTGITLNNGRIVLYIQGHVGGTTHPAFEIHLREEHNIILSLKANTGSRFYYFNSESNGYTSFGSNMNSDTWHKITIEWRGSDHKARYKINDENFTDWYGGLSDWSLGLNAISINLYGGAGFVDNIQEGITQEEKNPVLLVPGLMGTEIKTKDELLWMDLVRMGTDIGDNFMDKLSFNENLSSNDKLISLLNVLESKNVGPFKFDYTEALISELKNQGYIEGKTLFMFPYDWRYGVSGEFEDGTTVVDSFKQKINDILEKTGAKEVDVVAHSLGGLLVKKYVMENQATHHIGKAVFVGVPHTGAPKTVKTLLQGDNFGIPWLSQKEIKKIAKNMPSAYDLLPSQKYYNAAGSFVKLIKEKNSLFSLPETTVNDLDYGEFEDYIISDHALNETGFSNAKSLHSQSFDDFDVRSAGVDVFAINGCKEPTIKNITEKRSKNILGIESRRYDISFGLGDGTVPLESATNLPINQENKYYALISDHSKMLSQNGIRQQIVNIVAGSGLNVPNNIIWQDTTPCNLNGKVISVFSPIDISAKDQYGNYVGLVEDQSIINEIPGSALEVLEDHKFLFLPTDKGQNYTIDIKGTGDGTFTIKAQDVIENQVVETEVFSNLQVSNELTGQVHIAGATTLTIQNNSNSEVEIILPSSIVNGEQSKDAVPPVSTISVSGEMGQQDFYRSDAEINITVEDENSGVLSISYNIDGQGYEKVSGSTVDISLLNEGKHSVLFFATDKAGNNEEERMMEFFIDKTPPEAIMEFNPLLKELEFAGTDNLSEPEYLIIQENNGVVAVSDQAGNAIEISFERKNVKSLISSEIKHIKYNNTLADISKNKMLFVWNLGKDGSIKNLSQTANSKNGYNVVAVYDGKKTKIIGKDLNGRVFETINGLKTIKVSTKEGDLLWGY